MNVLPDPSDILALVLMAVFTVRRTDAKATEAKAFPRVAPADFEAWQFRAVRAWTLLGGACAAKVFLNLIWFFGVGSHVSFEKLRAGGALLFATWVVALLVGLTLAFRAKTLAFRLGIVEGGRLPQQPSS